MILYTLRSEGKVVLAVASSGIASLNTKMATLIKETCLIIWDESPMNDHRCFETLDRTLRDILDAPNRIFGGKMVMLGGDFRQTSPVNKAATRDEIIRSLVAKSYLWPHFKVHYLTENMCLNNEDLPEVDKQRMLSFAQWLLDVGNGQIGTPDYSGPENTSWIDILDEYYIPDDDNGIANLITLYLR
ncbi:DNA helicase [Tanacetum coccineum]